MRTGREKTARAEAVAQAGTRNFVPPLSVSFDFRLYRPFIPSEIFVMRFSGEPGGPDQARRAGNNSLEKHEPCQTESAENVFLEKVAILLDKTGTEGFSLAAGRYGKETCRIAGQGLRGNIPLSLNNLGICTPKYTQRLHMIVTQLLPYDVSFSTECADITGSTVDGGSFFCFFSPD